MSIHSMFHGLWSFLVAFLLCISQVACGDEPVDRVFPLGDIYELVFEGGIRLQEGTFGSSRAAYNVGPVTVDEDLGQIFVAGHAHHFSVGAYRLTKPKSSFSIADFPIAKNIQPYRKIQPPERSAGSPDRITGLKVVNNRLIVNVAEYYDGDGNNANTTMYFSDAENLAASTLHGFYTMDGRAHAAGWISEVPASLQSRLGGPYLSGYASNIPVNVRHSIGPSLFVWNPNALVEGSAQSGRVPAIPLIDYSLKQPLSDDLYNKSGTNRLWTEVSSAHVGLFALDSTDYLVVGSSGGHASGIGYKITQDNGKLCGGPCARKAGDYYNYFWRYDVSEFETDNRGRPAYYARPAEYGQLNLFTGVQKRNHLISGADFNAESERLYLLVNNVDETQNPYERQPVLLVYKLRRAASVTDASPSL
ncbi:MAG: hypothetical protein Cons2KO_30230 [Congregibacter sp.]